MDIDILSDSKTRKRLIKKTIETRKKELKNGKENRCSLDSWRDECFATLTPKNVKVKANLAIGRPKKRLSDGVCNKTKNQYIDEIVALIEEKAGDHGVDKIELLELINECCNTKCNKIEKKKSDVPIPTACAR